MSADMNGERDILEDPTIKPYLTRIDPISAALKVRSTQEHLDLKWESTDPKNIGEGDVKDFLHLAFLLENYQKQSVGAFYFGSITGRLLGDMELRTLKNLAEARKMETKRGLIHAWGWFDGQSIVFERIAHNEGRKLTPLSRPIYELRKHYLHIETPMQLLEDASKRIQICAAATTLLEAKLDFKPQSSSFSCIL